MKNYKEQLNQIKTNILDDLKAIKNKTFFSGDLSDIWSVSYDLPQYYCSEGEDEIQYSIIEMYEKNGNMWATGVDEAYNKQEFAILFFPVDVLIDLLEFNPVEINQ